MGPSSWAKSTPNPQLHETEPWMEPWCGHAGRFSGQGWDEVGSTERTGDLWFSDIWCFKSVEPCRMGQDGLYSLVHFWKKWDQFVGWVGSFLHIGVLKSQRLLVLWHVTSPLPGTSIWQQIRRFPKKRLRGSRWRKRESTNGMSLGGNFWTPRNGLANRKKAPPFFEHWIHGEDDDPFELGMRTVRWVLAESKNCRWFSTAVLPVEH